MFSTPKRLLKHVLRRVVQRTAPLPALAPETWGLAVGEGGVLHLGGVSLHAVGREHGFPAHVVNAERLRDNARRFLAVPPGCAKGCEVFSSYKTNPVPGVLQQLHAVDVGAEVISHYEFWLARRLGVPADRIVFNGPAKSEDAIREAIAADVALLTVNHREELAVVEREARRLEQCPRIGLRVSLGHAGTDQFGIPIEGGEALAAFGEALQSPYLNVVGIHAHRGRTIHTEHELRSFASAMLEFTETLHRQLGSALEILDFGGNLGTPTVRPLSAADLRLSRTFQREPRAPIVGSSLGIDRYVATLVGMVEAFHAERRRPRPRIFVEPGRALTGDTQLLLASVVNLKRARDRTFAILNAGINLAESCRSEYHHLLPVNRADRPPTGVYTIVGPICTPGDTLYWTARLPALVVGDSVAIMDTGAYFVPFSTAFSFPRPPIVSVDRGTVSILRRAEQFEDLVAYDALPGTHPVSPDSQC